MNASPHQTDDTGGQESKTPNVRLRVATAGVATALTVMAALTGTVLAGRQLTPARPSAAVGRVAAPTAGSPKTDGMPSQSAPTGTDTAVSTPTSTPVTDPAIAPCTDATALEVSMRVGPASMGNRYLIWTVGDSGKPCTLRGTPTIVVRDPAGVNMPVLQLTPDPSSPPPGTVTVDDSNATGFFYTDFYRCDDETPFPAGRYNISVSFSQLTQPIHLSLGYPFNDCPTQRGLVSPITQGPATAIPGFTTGGSPPD